MSNLPPSLRPLCVRHEGGPSRRGHSYKKPRFTMHVARNMYKKTDFLYISQPRMP
jgi:hypothetical protein